MAMKSIVLAFAVLALLTVGCRAPVPSPSTAAQGASQSKPLTAEAATAIARKAANEKAQSLYDCKPFVGSQAAEFVEGQWLWRERQPRGTKDIEATVRLAPEGS